MTRDGLTRTWTPGQLQAIGARGRTLVAAAAGSGKTGVLTERIVRALLGDGGSVAPPQCAPAEVLAVTFTRKAAAEMRTRIGDQLLAAGRTDLVAGLELATIGTIHSLCGEVLRRHGAAIGVDPGFRTLEESQDAWFAQLALDDALAELGADVDVAWLRARMRPGQLEETVRALRGRAGRTLDGRLTFPDPEEVTGNEATGVSTGAAQRATRALEAVWVAFQRQLDARLAAAGALTFDDLELLALRAARVPQVATALRARWQLVAIDEFQDTNARQLALLDEVAADRLFMVGDEWQSIYRFRGADVEVFRQQRAQAHGTTQVPMRENFRSDGPVLEVVNALFAHPEVFGDRYEPVVPGTERSRAVAGPSVELLVVDAAVDELTGHVAGVKRRDREVRRVAERIGELVHDEGVDPGSIVVLAETRTGFADYEHAIRARGIPTLRASSTGFFDHHDVRDALLALAAVRNSLDDRAALAFLAGPLGRLDWSTLAALAGAAGLGRVNARAGEVAPSRTSVLDAARVHDDPLAQVAARRFDSLVRIERTGSLVDLVSAVVRSPGLRLAAAQDLDGAQRVANLGLLVELASDAREVGVRDVARFLDFVEAQRRHRRIGDATIADEASGAVRMMTIHASKGLEFAHVFLVEAGRAPKGGSSFDQVPAPLVDARGRVHVAVPADDGKVRDTGALAAIRDADARADAQERMRKLYVGMTRARSWLHVSGVVDHGSLSERLVDPAAPTIDLEAGTLEWTLAALGVELPPPGRRVEAGSPALVIDTRPASTHPDPHSAGGLAGACVLAPASHMLAREAIDPASPDASADAQHAFARQLARTMEEAPGREWRLGDGSRLHDVVARLLDHARSGTSIDQLLSTEVEPWIGVRTRERLAPVVASPVFRRLVAAGARAEVPFIVRTGAVSGSPAAGGVAMAASADDVEAGRFDALARFGDGRWWIVDWKSSLPAAAPDAWEEHGPQLARYAEAARAGGATGVVLTLVALDEPDRTWTWSGDDVLPDALRRSAAPAMPACAGYP